MKEGVRAVTLLGLEELVAELGGDFRQLAAEAGFALADLRNTERLISARQAHELVNLAADQLGRKDLGLLWGARSDPSRLGPLHVALMNAQTGRQAVEMMVRFLHLNFPTGEMFLMPRPGERSELVGVRSHLRRPPSLVQFYERRVCSINVILKLVCGPGYRPEQIWFSHAQNAPINAYTRAFGVRPLFEMPENGVIIAQELLRAPRRAANAQVREMAVSYLKSQAALARTTSLSAETRYMIGILMRSTDATIGDTARALGMHPRTLQRRLQGEHASFEAIKDRVRRALALKLLADREIALLDVAFALHYANMSAFTRSCRRWFGSPPTQVRRGLLTAPRTAPARVRLRKVRLRA